MTSETTLQIAGIAVIGIALIFILKIVSDSFGQAFKGLGDVFAGIGNTVQGTTAAVGSVYNAATNAGPSIPNVYNPNTGSKNLTWVDFLLDPTLIIGNVDWGALWGQPSGPPIDPRTGGVKGGVYGPFP